MSERHDTHPGAGASSNADSPALRALRRALLQLDLRPQHAVDNMSDAEAERVQARYALGKRSNPDHDTTSYRDAAYDQQDHDRSATK
jgi:hypothetical protein